MRILRNIENDRCFPFTHALAKEKWIEMLDVPGSNVPDLISEEDKKTVQTTRVSKETLPRDEYEQMHWTRLKKEMERLGGSYKSPQQAVAFLRKADKEAEK